MPTHAEHEGGARRVVSARDADEWSCTSCTTINDGGVRCDMCRRSRRHAHAAAAEAPQQLGADACVRAAVGTHTDSHAAPSIVSGDSSCASEPRVQAADFELEVDDALLFLFLRWLLRAALEVHADASAAHFVDTDDDATEFLFQTSAVVDDAAALPSSQAAAPTALHVTVRVLPPATRGALSDMWASMLANDSDALRMTDFVANNSVAFLTAALVLVSQVQRIAGTPASPNGGAFFVWQAQTLSTLSSRCVVKAAVRLSAYEPAPCLDVTAEWQHVSAWGVGISVQEPGASLLLAVTNTTLHASSEAGLRAAFTSYVQQWLRARTVRAHTARTVDVTLFLVALALCTKLAIEHDPRDTTSASAADTSADVDGSAARSTTSCESLASGLQGAGMLSDGASLALQQWMGALSGSSWTWFLELAVTSVGCLYSAAAAPVPAARACAAVQGVPAWTGFLRSAHAALGSLLLDGACDALAARMGVCAPASGATDGVAAFVAALQRMYTHACALFLASPVASVCAPAIMNALFAQYLCARDMIAAAWLMARHAAGGLGGGGYAAPRAGGVAAALPQTAAVAATVTPPVLTCAMLRACWWAASPASMTAGRRALEASLRGRAEAGFGRICDRSPHFARMWQSAWQAASADLARADAAVGGSGGSLGGSAPGVGGQGGATAAAPTRFDAGSMPGAGAGSA
ncbi:MAG: hypothetical protein EOO41_02125, partial [Methanobacteriota archaeon]